MMNKIARIVVVASVLFAVSADATLTTVFYEQVGILNPMAPPYSAVCDGALHTDGAKINAAATALGSSGGGAVFIPAGKTCVVETSVLLPTNVTLRGAGMYTSTVKAKTNLNAPVVQNSGSTGVSVEDLTIDGNGTNQSTAATDALNFVGLTNGAVRRVLVKNPKRGGVVYQSVTRGWIEDVECTGSLGTGSNACVLLGDDTGGDAANQIVVRGVIAHDNASANGILVEHGDGNIISNSIATVNGRTAHVGTGIKVGGLATNTIIDGTYATVNGTGYHVQGGAKYTSIIGSNAYRNDDDGLKFGATDSNSQLGNLVVGNISTENGQDPGSETYCISIANSAGTTKGSAIVGNVCMDNQVSKTQDRGINVGSATGTISNVVVSGNEINGSTFSVFDPTSASGSALAAATYVKGPNSTDDGVSGAIMGITGIGGVSGITARNFAGQITLSGASNSASLTFGTAEIDANYEVEAVPVSFTGTPSAGSNRVLNIAKFTTSAVLAAEAGPGVGNTYTFDIYIFRR